MAARRSVLAVPGSDPVMLETARGWASDAVLFDLEDAVAPAHKSSARGSVVEALTGGGWGSRLRTVRVNDLSTHWTYRDVIEVVEGAGQHLDAVVLPKVLEGAQVRWLDLLLTQIEVTMGLRRGGIGIEAQIDTAAGLQNVASIAAASPRLHSLVFASGALATALGMRAPSPGVEPFAGALDAASIAVRTAATAAGLQAVDGPWQQSPDPDGFRSRAARSAQLGFDGTWVLRASEIEVAHQVFAGVGQAPGRTQDSAPTT